MTPEEIEDVPVPEGACGQAASGAILLALVQDHPERASEKAQACLSRGREIALEEVESPLEAAPPTPEPGQGGSR